jgi:hypothetical protein
MNEKNRMNEQEPTKQITYAEAMRYMANAQETLQKAHKEDNHYLDHKYVRTACGTAYNGVLIALDTWLVFKGVQRPKNPKRASINFYQSSLAKLDGKMLTSFCTVYNTLRIGGYYGGEQDAIMLRRGFEAANAIIAKIKPEQELPLEALKQPSWWNKFVVEQNSSTHLIKNQK